MGDVVLSLPALRALRSAAANAKITVLHGKPAADIIRIAGVADDQIAVDRVALRDGNKLVSIGKIISLVREIRRRHFDFVIDLHSLSETNILGFLSGAKWRLYANRENRSLDRLSRFPTRPPAEDKSIHHAERYLNVLKPLGIVEAERGVRLTVPADAMEDAANRLAELGVGDRRLIGLFLGAGHPSRRWSVDNFVELAARLRPDARNCVLVFLGPEERDLRAGLAEKFEDSAVIVDELPLISFIAMLSRLDVLVTGDTGPMHLAAIAGAGIVLLSEIGAATVFLPLTDDIEVLRNCTIQELSVDAVETAVLRLMRRSKADDQA